MKIHCSCCWAHLTVNKISYRRAKAFPPTFGGRAFANWYRQHSEACTHYNVWFMVSAHAQVFLTIYCVCNTEMSLNTARTPTPESWKIYNAKCGSSWTHGFKRFPLARSNTRRITRKFPAWSLSWEHMIKRSRPQTTEIMGRRMFNTLTRNKHITYSGYRQKYIARDASLLHQKELWIVVWEMGVKQRHSITCFVSTMLHAYWDAHLS